MQFEDLNLNHKLLDAVRTEGYTQPTPIQERAIPHVLAGKDLLGCAQTGTGKTAAFALPILQRLAASGNGNGRRPIRTLVLAPTRELATQIGESFKAYGRKTGLKVTIIFGGVGQNPQVQALKRGVDILVATPGRLLDLIGQGHVHLERAEVLVLDEADRMLDMGFIHDVRRVVKAMPKQRQTLLFSATMPRDIQELADAILVDPVQVSVAPPTMTVEDTEQAVYLVEKSDKMALLRHLLDDPAVTRVLVFTRTKHGANRVVKQLSRSRVSAEPIHGNKSQTARERALANFKKGKTRVLVATDIAARGIDVDSISHVINYDLPNEPETYVHRIGRTGRAGASGIAYSFCSVDERAYLRDIERLIKQRVTVVDEHPYVSTQETPKSTKSEGHRRQRTKPQNGNSNGNGHGRRRRNRRSKQNGARAQQSHERSSSDSRPPASRRRRSTPKPAPSSENRRPPRLVR
jgi:ATP-dependent RNA helicase RhlE